MAPSILIQPQPFYLADESAPEQAQYVFGYEIRIENSGALTVQLLERHWLITDANGQRLEVQGPGVVGEQPFIAPGSSFSYQSSVSLKTPFGIMEGHYSFQDEQGALFDVSIPTFTLATPNLIH